VTKHPRKYGTASNLDGWGNLYRLPDEDQEIGIAFFSADAIEQRIQQHLNRILQKKTPASRTTEDPALNFHDKEITARRDCQ